MSVSSGPSNKKCAHHKLPEDEINAFGHCSFYCYWNICLHKNKWSVDFVNRLILSVAFWFCAVWTNRSISEFKRTIFFTAQGSSGVTINSWTIYYIPLERSFSGLKKAKLTLELYRLPEVRVLPALRALVFVLFRAFPYVGLCRRSPWRLCHPLCFHSWEQPCDRLSF